jgi:hypothetical protein
MKKVDTALTESRALSTPFNSSSLPSPEKVKAAARSVVYTRICSLAGSFADERTETA